MSEGLTSWLVPLSEQAWTHARPRHTQFLDGALWKILGHESERGTYVMVGTPVPTSMDSREASSQPIPRLAELWKILAHEN